MSNVQEYDETDVETSIAPPQESKGELAIFSAARLPFHPQIEQRFGISKGAWKVLTEAIFPAARTPDAIVMALSYCQARKLDIFKRPVHIVPMWSTQLGRYVETVWPGIAELRTTAARTHQYSGCDAAEFGPAITQTFTGRAKVKKEWKDISAEVTFPSWCRVTVYREVGGVIRKFVGPKVNWLESYATIGNSPVPNDMWQSRAEGQLEKCAEAAALRRAFPEEVGNELTAEEMHGRVMDDTPAPPPVDVTAAPPDPDKPAAAKSAGPPDPGAEKLTPEAEAQFLKDLDGALSGCEDMVSLGEKQKTVMVPMKGNVSVETWKVAEAQVLDHFKRIQDSTILNAG